MNVQTVGWFLFLALSKNFATKILFKLTDTHLTATEGSCAEIKCTVSTNINDNGAYWFWMKDAVWIQKKESHDAVIIYSTNTTKRPVSPDFAKRVTYIGIPSSGWNNNDPPPTKPCSISICDLNKNDSGNYKFRFLGLTKENTWVTDPLNLTVTDNPCLITFEKPPAAMENDSIILTCSTSSLCTSDPTIEGLPRPARLVPTQPPQGKKKSTIVTFEVKWDDDGRQLSCQTEDNKDPYLIRNINLTVKYAPQNTLAEISHTTIKERQSVILTCSAKGNPAPQFKWYKVKQQSTVSGAKWEIPSIQESQSGEYYCEAFNDHGKKKSNTVTINVTYEPQVKVTSNAPVVKEGDGMTLKCSVMRSNPQPHTFTWLKNQVVIAQQNEWSVKYIRPEDGGSYTCRAVNSAGTGTSQPFQITVEYKPRKATISVIENERAKVGKPLTIICNVDAKPAPQTYSWYRYNRNKAINSPWWTSYNTEINQLTLETVQRTDEAYYTCNATNAIGTGDDSESMLVKVQYPPTNLNLSMDPEVKEGQLTTISCTVDSFPKSNLKLMRTSTLKPQSSEITEASTQSSNTLQKTFNVTPTHTGVYTCVATNSEGTEKSKQRTLVVNYPPKDVTVRASPGLNVTENTLLTLHCEFHSFPEETSVTWMTMTNEKTETIKTRTIKIKSVSLSDSGRYRCEASNEIGSGRSKEEEVKVKYAPKHTEISKGAEKQQRDGTTSVTLSCSSHTFPPVREYLWYKKREAEEGGEKVSRGQNYIVNSEDPGVYYCIAKNELGQKSSEPVELFVDRGIMKALKFVVLFLIILLVVVLIFFVYSHRRKKSIQQRTANTPPCFGFLGWRTYARRRSLRGEPVMSEPFRSRDDLLPEQPSHPNAQRRQPRPDSTPASNINSVYCTVNLPVKQQGPAAQQPVRQQGGHTDKESLNYASLHFGNKQKRKEVKTEATVVYAKVSKQKPPKKNEQEKLADYENINAAHAAKSPNPLDYDTDTSEDEVEVNYSQVSFKAKAGHQRAGRESSSDTSSDSSTSDEEETQYSQVKI